MVVLKLPIAALLYIVWRAINDVEPIDEPTDGEDGGSKTPPEPSGPRVPRRRGPHGEPPLSAPPRRRTPAVARRPTPHRD